MNGPANERSVSDKPPVTPPGLPHTWRAFGTLMVATIGGLMLAAVVVTGWFAVEQEVRDSFSAFQRLTLLGMALGVACCWWALLRTRVTAEDSGLTVVNGFRTRRYEWSQVIGVNLRRGAPWAGIDLSDGTSISAVAIQATDGSRAIAAVRALRVLIAAHTPDTPA